MATNDDRLMAMLLYVLSLFVPVIGPLVIWLVKRDQSEFIDYHGKEYFNFLISYTIYFFVSGLLTIILIGIVGIILIGIYVFVFTIIAAVKAYDGQKYRIPLVIRIIR